LGEVRTFIEDIAELMCRDSGSDLSNRTILVPSLHIGKKLQYALAAHQTSSVWSPRIQTMAEFVQSVSGYRISQRIHLLPLLYRAYIKTGFRSQSFDEFTSLGESMLSDFDDVLLSLANEKVLFDDLRNIKEIEDWSYQLGELSDTQERFLHLWKCMGDTFQDYVEQQKSKSIYSYSLLVREVIASEKLTSYSEHCYFIAGQTLHKAEKKILEQLSKSGNLTVFCDRDDYYIEGPSNEASSFLKKNLHGIEVTKTPTDFWKNSDKTIFIRNSQTLVGCCMKAAGILESEGHKTGYILATKDILLPALEHLPENAIKNIHISGGYPIHITPLFRLIQSILDLLSEAEQNPETQRRRFYKDVLEIVRNASLGLRDVDGLKKYLIDHNLVYLDNEDLNTLQIQYPAISPVMPFFLEEIKDGKKTIELVQQLLKALEENNSDESSISLIVEAAIILENCEEFVTLYDFTQSISSLNFVWKKWVHEHHLSFAPANRDQIEILTIKDSLLEDFDRIILVGANEGDLPQTPPNRSLIPMDVRRIFGIPVSEDEEERQAYLFYRLLQRPKEIHLFYSTLPKSFGSSEQSRYITQLSFESADRIEYVQDYFPSVTDRTEKTFTQDKNSLERIRLRLSDGLSASAIATYFNCPLDYFYKYALGLGEAPVMEETIQPSTFGTIAHAVLESFYRPHIGSFPAEKDYESALANLDAMVRDKFNEHYSLKQSKTGKNFISVQVLTETLQRFLKAEKAELSSYSGRVIHAIEHQVKIPLTVNASGENVLIHLKGTIDRIDRVPEGYEIIDFKTGKVSQENLKVKSVAAAFKPQQGKMIQVLMYLYMAHKELNVDPGLIRACLISLQNFRKGRIYGYVNEDRTLTEDGIRAFEEAITHMVEELLSDRTFEHSSSNRYCEYCT
jgi:ATP-dependent helicase/nuclease subunit B